MTIDLLLEVGHATVADLDCVTVEDFVEHMIFRELFVEDFKERSSNVGSHGLAKRWVIPNDVFVAVPSGVVRRLCYAWCESEPVIVAAVIQGFLIKGCRFIKRIFIKGDFGQSFVDGFRNVFDNARWMV